MGRGGSSKRTMMDRGEGVSKKSVFARLLRVSHYCYFPEAVHVQTPEILLFIQPVKNRDNILLFHQTVAST